MQGGGEEESKEILNERKRKTLTKQRTKQFEFYFSNSFKMCDLRLVKEKIDFKAHISF